MPSRPESRSKSVDPGVSKWVFKIMNPIMKALLRSPPHGVISGTLMLLTYQGRKTGKWYTHPVGYFNWDQDEVIAVTSARWWINLQDGRHVRLRIKGQEWEAIPTVIQKRDEVILTVAEFYTRLGLKKARMLPLGLPTGRQPTDDELQSIRSGITFVRFKLIEKALPSQLP